MAPAQGPSHNPWFDVAEAHKPIVDAFGYMRVEDLTQHWLENDPKALMQPFLIERPEGLDMKVLPADMQISEIADMVGRDRQLDVIGERSHNPLGPLYSSNTRRRRIADGTQQLDTRTMGRLL